MKFSGKNRGGIVQDIRPRSGDFFGERISGAVHRKPQKPKRKMWKKTAIAVIVVALIVIGFYGVRAWQIKSLVQSATPTIYKNLDDARRELQNLNPNNAKMAFVAADSDIKNIENEVNKYGFAGILSFWGKSFQRVAAIPKAIASVSRLSTLAISVSEDVARIKDQAFSLMMNKGGEELIRDLRSAHEKITVIATTLDTLTSQASLLTGTDSGALLTLQVNLYRNEKLLKGIIDFLDSPIEHHLIIAFQNPSEIRPGGGFAGSYADIGLLKGNLTNITIRDIYDPDGQLPLKIIPPHPLQLITRTWGARDAHWFLDFPTSAKKILYFLNNSKIYSEKLISFEGLAAINVNVIEDLLKVIGPIELPEYKLTLTDQNFLTEVQREVESGTDKKNGEPKRILKVLTPILFERLAKLTDEQKKVIVDNFNGHIEQKDFTAYINDVVIESYIKGLGFAGEVYENAERAPDEYLAFVNANIGGGKTDAFINQNITLNSKVDLDGSITNNLTVTRQHTGEKQKEWWYKQTNQNYFQIYTPRGTQASAASGSDTAPKITAWDYTGYKADPDVTAIEDSLRYSKIIKLDQFTAFNRAVFAGWLMTKAGTTRTVKLEYANPKNLKLTPGKTPYEFVFEKQAGQNTAFTFTIEAPTGYKWEETGDKIYTYSSTNAPGRLILTLNLMPVR